jgi:hypothetical protein
MATVDVETGYITPSTQSSLTEGTAFSWTCSEAPANTSITVHAEKVSGKPWFVTSSGSGSVSFTTPNASEAVTPQETGDDCTWLATGVEVDEGAHVVVVSTVPQRKAS